MKHDQYILLIIGSVFSLYSIYHLIPIWRLYRKIWASRNWPEAVGTVNGFEIGKAFRGRGFDSYAIIKYSYEILGINYNGRFKIYTFGSFSPRTDDDAINDASKYPPGFILPIHYNPRKPQEAISHYDGEDRSILIINIMLFTFGILAILIGIFLK